MEEAYRELYQEFIRLRSLCLRQAAMLHQLTTALQKQQGATNPKGELSNSCVQFIQEIPVYFQGNPVTTNNPAAKSNDNQISRNVASNSNRLAEDMTKLCMNGFQQRGDDRKGEESKSQLLALDSSNPKPADNPGGSRTLHTSRMPMAEGFMSQPGRLLMSDVALQSHVCDFCEAVFPGYTTTRGEFLRHLYTHVT